MEGRDRSKILEALIQAESAKIPVGKKVGDSKPATVRPEAGDAFFEGKFPVEALSHASETTRIACDSRLRDIVIALNNREIIKPNNLQAPGLEYFIKPSVFLWPFPGWNNESRRLEIRVYSFDADEQYEPLEEIVQELLSLSNFRDSENTVLSKGEVNNLIRALTEFFYGMVDWPSKMTFSQIPDYETTARTIEKASFVAKGKGYNPMNVINVKNNGKGSRKIIVDQMKALEFRRWLIDYFMDKHQQIKRGVEEVRDETHERIITGPRAIGHAPTVNASEDVQRILSRSDIRVKKDK